MIGSIKALRNERGFGFIREERTGEEYFFHASCLDGGAFDELRQGDQVEFDGTEGAKGRRAERVRLTGK